MAMIVIVTVHLQHLCVCHFLSPLIDGSDRLQVFAVSYQPPMVWQSHLLRHKPLDLEMFCQFLLSLLLHASGCQVGWICQRHRRDGQMWCGWRWRVSAENATNANSRLVGAGIKALVSIIVVAAVPPVVLYNPRKCFGTHLSGRSRHHRRIEPIFPNIADKSNTATNISTASAFISDATSFFSP